MSMKILDRLTLFSLTCLVFIVERQYLNIVHEVFVYEILNVEALVL